MHGRGGEHVCRLSTALYCYFCVATMMCYIVQTTASIGKHMPSSVSATVFPGCQQSAGLMLLNGAESNALSGTESDALSGAESGAVVRSVQGDSSRAMAGPWQVLAAAGTGSCQVLL